MVAACFSILLINELGRHVTISWPNITGISHVNFVDLRWNMYFGYVCNKMLLNFYRR